LVLLCIKNFKKDRARVRWILIAFKFPDVNTLVLFHYAAGLQRMYLSGSAKILIPWKGSLPCYSFWSRNSSKRGW